MDYRSAITYIIERSGYDRGFVANPFDAETIGLQRTSWLVAALGHPETVYPTVHIAGTKGKGSTAACLAAILTAAGLRVGVYSSPHLHTFRERIQIEQRPISKELFASLTAEIAPLNEQLARDRPEWGEATAFEVSTALAWLAFARVGVDIALVEVGLGGRLDATNLLLPAVSVITSISYDHTKVLGDTLSEIAREKGGIIKPGRPVVVGPQPDEARETLERLAAERGSRLLLAGRDWQTSGTSDSFILAGPWGSYHDLRVSLRGAHQVENAANAVAAAWLLTESGVVVPESALRKGLAQVSWPGRFEIINERPTVVVDGAHNLDSVRRLAETLRAEYPNRPVTLILGIAGDKDVEGMLTMLAPLATRIIATSSHHPRAARPERISAVANNLGVASTEAMSVASALERALQEAGPDDLICVTGSLYAVAEAREALGLATADEFERGLLFS